MTQLRASRAGRVQPEHGEGILTIHPLSMACYAVALGLRDDNVIATILLHDTVEDCGVRPEYLPVSDTVKRAVQHMTIVKFDTDLDKIETKCRYFNELLNNREALICKALDRYNNLGDMPMNFTKDAMGKNVAETEVLLLPVPEGNTRRFLAAEIRFCTAVGL